MARGEQYTLSETARSELAALDAALDGERVAPEHGDLADIALLLREERRRPGPELLARLDELAAGRVAERRGVWRELPHARRAPARRRRAPLGRRGMMAAIAVILVVLAIPAAFALLGGRAQQRSHQQGDLATSAVAQPAATNDGVVTTPTPRAGKAEAAPPGTGSPPGASARAVQRTATLELGVPGHRLASVDQQVFSIVNSFHGYVQQSSSTLGAEQHGSASFQLRVPSANVSGTIAALSQLGSVLSETNTTNDVTEQLDSLQSSLNDARAQRAALLAKLSDASDVRQADALRGRLAAIEARIAHLRASLGSLQNQVSYTPITLALTAERPSHAVTGDGLTPGGALRDAGHILSVALAVLLLAAAAALPIALAVLLCWSVLGSTRRRQRERALDAQQPRAPAQGT